MEAIRPCPKCGSHDVADGDEGHWPECMECSFVQYDEYTLEIQREVLREQEQCKAIHGRVLTYEEWVKASDDPNFESEDEHARRTR